MNWKVITSISLILLFVITSNIVWNNRASDKLVSSSLSVIILGLIGLLITSLTSLKEEKKKGKFAALLFLEKKPLSLANYKYRMRNKDRITPIIMINNALGELQKENERYSDLDLLMKEKSWKPIDDLFQRYIFDLIMKRYGGHWYLESIVIKGSSYFSGLSNPIDSSIESKRFKWRELSQIFPHNEFIKIGYSNNTKVNGMIDFALPPNTELKKDTTINGFKIHFDNDFINLKIKCEHYHSDTNMNKEIQTAYRMNEKTKDNFSFQPFIFDYEITKKKFRSGHPDMPKYEYWANDLVSFLEKNISVDEFWRVVELNN